MSSGGVVGMAEVVVPNSSATPGKRIMGTPAMWSFVWVGAALLFLVIVHMAMIGKAGR